MNDWYYDDDSYDCGWFDERIELEEELNEDNPPKKIVNDLDYKYFQRLNEKEKVIYLYNKIRDVYSYLLTIQDVVYKEGD